MTPPKSRRPSAATYRATARTPFPLPNPASRPPQPMFKPHPMSMAPTPQTTTTIATTASTVFPNPSLLPVVGVRLQHPRSSIPFQPPYANPLSHNPHLSLFPVTSLYILFSPRPHRTPRPRDHSRTSAIVLSTCRSPRRTGNPLPA